MTRGKNHNYDLLQDAVHITHHKYTEPLNHPFMYSLVLLLSGIHPLPAMHLLLVTLYVTEYFLSNNCGAQ